MGIPAPKEVSVVLFYNFRGEILLQDRRKISKWGEEYGFFGGSLEQGETGDQAIAREVEEELGLTGVKFDLFKRYEHENKELGFKVKRNVYLSSLPDLTSLVCNEGELAIRRFNNSLDLKMIPGFNELLGEIYAHLKEEGKTI